MGTFASREVTGATADERHLSEPDPDGDGIEEEALDWGAGLVWGALLVGGAALWAAFVLLLLYLL